ncbi:MAG: exonuclease domain-containing protein [Anaerolinea sp.]|nr:exonuclease domain-containing protein [Anaerolinea sp.]
MDIKQDHLIIVDIEASCWLGQPPPGEQNEIIEIGVCLLALDTGAISQQASILVKPTRSKISAFCTELTTLTQELVDTGIHFYEACDRLRADYDSPQRIWASWGNYDKNMFISQCASFGVEYPFSPQHINLKKVFNKVYKQRAPGMTAALDLLNLPLTGTHHRGGDDAYNIAVISGEMLKLRGNTIFGVK